MLSVEKHNAILKVAVKERNVSCRLASTLANFIFPCSDYFVARQNQGLWISLPYLDIQVVFVSLQPVVLPESPAFYIL